MPFPMGRCFPRRSRSNSVTSSEPSQSKSKWSSQPCSILVSFSWRRCCRHSSASLPCSSSKKTKFLVACCVSGFCVPYRFCRAGMSTCNFPLPPASYLAHSPVLATVQTQDDTLANWGGRHLRACASWLPFEVSELHLRFCNDEIHHRVNSGIASPFDLVLR